MYRRKKSFALLLAIILIATVCMPIHAENIYPLNDTISTDNTELSSSNFAYHRDYTTGEVTMVDLTKIPRYNYQNTHECLSDEKLALTRAADDAYYNRLEMASANSGATRSTLSVIDPTSDILYKGVVLITVWADDADGYNRCIHHGTGFMVDDNVVVTAAHVANDTTDPDDSITEVRVYPNVHYAIPSADLAQSSLSSYSYVTVSSATYGVGDENNDWYVGTLSSSINNTYFFNCTTVDSSIVDESVYAIGYGGSYKYRKVQSYGTIFGYYLNNIYSNNVAEGGMSGGPIYAYMNGRPCVAIIRAGGENPGNNNSPALAGQVITTTVLNIIYDRILEY